MNCQVVMFLCALLLNNTYFQQIRSLSSCIILSSANSSEVASIVDCVPNSRKTSRLKINSDEESHVTLLLFLQPHDDVTDHFHNILPGSLIELYLNRILILKSRDKCQRPELESLTRDYHFFLMTFATSYVSSSRT